MNCNRCNKEISEKVAEFSRERYGKFLCFNCQKLESVTEKVPAQPSHPLEEYITIMSAIKVGVEKAFDTTMEKQPEIIPCINSIFIAVTRRNGR